MLEFGLQKNHYRIIAASTDVLPRRSGNFGAILLQEKFPTFFRIFRGGLVKGGPELMLVPGLDCSFNGPACKWQWNVASLT